MEQIPESEIPMVEKRNRPMIQTWIDALTNPNTEMYAELAQAENAKTNTAWLWVFIGALVGAVISSILTAIFGNPAMTQIASMIGETSAEIPLEQTGIGSILIGIVCGAPLGALLGTLFFALGIVIQNWIANMFGGEGSLDSFAFVYAAFSAPIGIVTSTLAAIPFVGPLLSGLVGLYSLYLAALTLHVVKRLSWGKAIIVLLIPLILVAILFGCLAALLVPIIISSFSNTFGQ
ncbi:MAG: YIP1 family protein [Anaerolineaceae bacterium]|nr:YIP1 family protein [Anaerolineaceae bacterium]